MNTIIIIWSWIWLWLTWLETIFVLCTPSGSWKFERCPGVDDDRQLWETAAVSLWWRGDLPSLRSLAIGWQGLRHSHCRKRQWTQEGSNSLWRNSWLCIPASPEHDLNLLGVLGHAMLQGIAQVASLCLCLCACEYTVSLPISLCTVTISYVLYYTAHV